MQHVMFGDVLGAAEAVDAAEPKASSRAISGSLDDVDDHVPGAQLAVSDGPARASSLELIPTQAGRLHAKSRPKMSFYSPVAIGGDDTADVGAPWEEYAKLADGPAQHLHRSQQRQKYLRIDVEVVGSRWVTADKFAQGLF
ncbi:hypothetical protein LPJ53_006602 [Coemansia erecta]|uniref:Uncharacterized protein n=1 Tax=Coemansia erecta TaxID=147472 RepID=A0A9W7XPK5_9FUNG|nr:hypothetical protein LPJ53_006602 [Coemansia erecta]